MAKEDGDVKMYKEQMESQDSMEEDEAGDAHLLKLGSKPLTVTQDEARQEQ
jgi:hypothetical protein